VCAELLIERNPAAAGWSAHLHGRVARVLPACSRRSSRAAWSARRSLHVADIREQRTGHGEPAKPIEKFSPRRAGLVQVLKDPIGSKGARLSTQISIAGRMAGYPAAGPAQSASRKKSRTRAGARPCATG